MWAQINMVARMGFEPMSPSLKGLHPNPVDERALTFSITIIPFH